MCGQSRNEINVVEIRFSFSRHHQACGPCVESVDGRTRHPGTRSLSRLLLLLLHELATQGYSSQTPTALEVRAEVEERERKRYDRVASETMDKSNFEAAYQVVSWYCRVQKRLLCARMCHYY